MADIKPNLPEMIKTGDGMFILDREQKIIFWNSAAARFLGYPVEEAIGEKCWKLLQGCTLKGENICRAGGPIITKATYGDNIRNFDLCVRHRDGHTVLINISTIALLDEQNGRIHSVLHLFRPFHQQPDWSGMLRIHLLGPVMVERADGSIVSGPLWQRVKVRALLAYLALRERRHVEREILLDQFWPDLDHSAALRNLNTTVYNLRHSLEPDLESAGNSQYIFYEGGQYWFGGAGHHWLDTKAFMGNIRQARAENDLEKAAAAYQRALALYRGDYLADLSITTIWSPAEQYRYQEFNLSALEELGTIFENQGLLQEAKETYLRAIVVAPWRETAVRKLISLQVKSGNRAAAVQQCRRLQEDLQTNLGVEPCPETRHLCRELFNDKLR